MRNVFISIVDHDENGSKRPNLKIRTRNKQLSKFLINRLTINCNDEFEIFPVLYTKTLSRPSTGIKVMFYYA